VAAVDAYRTEVARRGGYRCEYCGYPEAARSTPLEVDHMYNPRTLQWNEHFLLNRSTGEIHGSTPIGRASVEALVLNSGHAIATTATIDPVTAYLTHRLREGLEGPQKTSRYTLT
jgi:hypothetical protein